MKQPYTTIKEMEIHTITRALNICKNKKIAAKRLGITERTLYNKMVTYKLK